MAYTSGSTIEALHYNTFVQGGATVNHGVANFNTVVGVGYGTSGYGQTANVMTPAVATSTSVTATQWSSMIASLNTIMTFQNNTTISMVSPTAGAIISPIASIDTAINQIYTNKLLSYAIGTTVSSGPAPTVWATASPTTFSLTRTATFVSADAARYFFNTGGQIQLTISATNDGGTVKGADWVTMLNTKMGNLTVGSITNSCGGVGGTTTGINTGLGYWNVGTTNVDVITKSSASVTADYSLNTAAIGIKTNGVQGANGDVGHIITFLISLNDGASDDGLDESLNLSINAAITARPSNAPNTWGTITIA